MSIYVGIDPGRTGAVALYSPGCMGIPEWWRVADWSGHVRDLDRILRPVIAGPGVARLVVEWQPTRPGQPPRVALWLGAIIGRVQGYAQALGVRVAYADPRRWVHWIERRWGCVAVAAPKRARLAAVQDLWPDAPVHGPRGGYLDDRGDAILLAAYGRDEMGPDFRPPLLAGVIVPDQRGGLPGPAAMRLAGYHVSEEVEGGGPALCP